MSPRRRTWQPSDSEVQISEVGKKTALISVGLLTSVVLAVIAWVVAWRFWGFC